MRLKMVKPDFEDGDLPWLELAWNPLATRNNNKGGFLFSIERQLSRLYS